MELVGRLFTDIEPLSKLEQDYTVGGPLSLERDGRWLARVVLQDGKPQEELSVSQEWIQITNKVADIGNSTIRDPRSSRELALVEPTNAARLEVLERLGWTQPGGLFAEVAAKNTLSPQDLPKCSHLFQVLRMLFACTGARIMEPLLESKSDDPNKSPALAYSSPAVLSVQLSTLLEAEIPADHVADILIGFPGLFSQIIKGPRADETLVSRAWMFLDDGKKVVTTAQKIASRRHRGVTRRVESLAHIPTEELTTWPIAPDRAGRISMGQQSRSRKTARRQPAAEGNADTPANQPANSTPRTKMGPAYTGTSINVAEKLAVYTASTSERKAAIRSILDYFVAPDLEKLLVICPGILECDQKILDDYLAKLTYDELSDRKLVRDLQAVLPPMKDK